jgi:hypothetical protein
LEAFVSVRDKENPMIPDVETRQFDFVEMESADMKT